MRPKLWSVALWLLVWQIGSMALVAAVPHGGLLLASPVRSFCRLLELLPQDAFWRAVGRSSLQILGGFLTACVLAVVLAALASGRRRLRELLAPPVAVVKATPVVSFIILALVWLDERTLPLFISALMVFPPVYLNVLEGICRTDLKLLELARVYRIPLRRRLRGIYLPQVLPYFRTAASLGLGLCWKAGVAAEVIAISGGTIGERLWTAKNYFQTPDLFAWTAMILALSAAFEHLFLAAVDRISREVGC